MNIEEKFEVLINALTILEIPNNNEKINLENHLARLRHKLEKENDNIETNMKINMITGMLKAIEKESLSYNSDKTKRKWEDIFTKKNKHIYFNQDE